MPCKPNGIIEALNRGKMRKTLTCLISAFIVFALFMLLLYREGMVPFGKNTLCYDDMFYQYNDLFSYMGDCLKGKNSIAYTMSKMLGGTGIAVFAYYLSSIFSLLLPLFDKADIVLYFHLVIGLKLALIAGTTAFFLQERFKDRLTRTFTVLLSISFALMQYNIAQCCCIMWLDGVFMLPLILLGTGRLVREKKPLMLMICVGLALIFNWYTGVIDVIAAIFWFLLETGLYLEESGSHRPVKESLIWFLKRLLIFSISLFIGAMLSAVLVLPALSALSRNGRGFIDWSLFKPGFDGNILTIFLNWVLGGKSGEGSVAIFTGSLALIGTLCQFTSRTRTKGRKLIIFMAILVNALFYYFKPFIGLLSLGKDVQSYWYRYSYVSGILLVFLAADYFSTVSEEKKEGRKLLFSAAVFSLLVVSANYIRKKYELRWVLLTAFFCLTIAILLFFYIRCLKKNKRFFHPLSACLLSAGLILELALNTWLLQISYSEPAASLYKDYAKKEEKQVDSIESEDRGFYRISQTSNFSMSESGQSAHYNEALAFHYASLASYTSDPNDRERIFLDRLGYRINGENFNIVNVSILPVDSLLGVRYVLSPYNIKGLKLMSSMPANDSKLTYENPFALPMALVYKGRGRSLTDSNVVFNGDTRNADSDDYDIVDKNGKSVKADDETFFSYINSLYEQLTGEEVKLFVPLTYTREDLSSREKRYTIDIPEGNYSLYGNIVWDNYWNGSIALEDGRNVAYASWCTPGVFYIPAKSGETSTSIDVTGNEDIYNRKEIFAALDLDELKRVTDLLKSRNKAKLVVKNAADLTLRTEGKKGESAFISLPYEEGWTIERNGKKVEPELFGDCMISLPLTDGENVIKLHYEIPDLKAGIACTVTALVLLLLYGLYCYRKRNIL